MFTGIVESTGRVLSRRSPLLRILPEAPWGRAAVGESVAVDGVCLTVDRSERGELLFRLLPETARATTLGSLKPGIRVNLERSLRLGDRVGGHLLLGHVDGKGRILSRKRSGDALTLEIALPAAWAALLVPKAPVAVDGVSLTVGAAMKGRFSVHLVAHTLSATPLGAKKAGQEVNLEVDPVAKYLRAML